MLSLLRVIALAVVTTSGIGTFETCRQSPRTSACWGQTGSSRHTAKVTRLTRMYGPAVRCKRFSSSWHSAVLHQCIRSLIGADLLRTIMDISARAISLADRPQRAIRVTSVRMRREDRSSISCYLSQTSAGKGFGLHHGLSLQCFRRSGFE